MVKDRLAEMNKLKEGNKKKDGKCKEIPLEILDPFSAKVEKIQIQLNTLKEDIDKAKGLHSFLLNLKESDKKIINDHQSKLNKLHQEIKKASITIKCTLQQMKESNETVQVTRPSKKKKNVTVNPKKVSQTLLRIRETQFSYLRKWFVDLMTEYSGSQSMYFDKQKKLLKTQLQVMGVDKSDVELEKMLLEPLEDLFTGNHLKMTKAIKQQMTEANARHKIVLEIEKSIGELNDLFTEMAAMVEDQGATVNNIQAHVARAAGDVESGRQQVQTAAGLKNKRIICLSLVGCHILLILVLAAAFFAYKYLVAPKKKN